MHPITMATSLEIEIIAKWLATSLKANFVWNLELYFFYFISSSVHIFSLRHFLDKNMLFLET